MKIFNCKCCKQEIRIKKLTSRKYCKKCSESVTRLTSRLKVREIDRCRKCRKEMEAKYKFIATIREPVKKDTENKYIDSSL